MISTSQVRFSGDFYYTNKVHDNPPERYQNNNLPDVLQLIYRRIKDDPDIVMIQGETFVGGRYAVSSAEIHHSYGTTGKVRVENSNRKNNLATELLSYLTKHKIEKNKPKSPSETKTV